MDASLHRSVLATRAAKDIPTARPSPNEGSAPHLQGEIFFSGVKKVANTFQNLYPDFNFREETIL